MFEEQYIDIELKFSLDSNKTEECLDKRSGKMRIMMSGPSTDLELPMFHMCPSVVCKPLKHFDGWSLFTWNVSPTEVIPCPINVYFILVTSESVSSLVLPLGMPTAVKLIKRFTKEFAQRLTDEFYQNSVYLTWTMAFTSLIPMRSSVTSPAKPTFSRLFPKSPTLEGALTWTVH